MENAVIVSAVRTPIGGFLGGLQSTSAIDLGTAVAREAIRRAGIDAEEVEDIVAGMVYKHGARGNPARQVGLASGTPESISGVTVDQQCSSGMRAVEIGAQQIMLGVNGVALAVGMENMSQAPYLLLNARTGYRLGSGSLEDALLHDALNDAFHRYHMGVTAENLAERYAIGREEQDELALQSHQRACRAIEQGTFREEILPIETRSKKKTVWVETDEHPRSDTSMENLAKLRPVFKEGGTVTAGNASGINDGAAALVLMSEKRAQELGVAPMARILSSASYSVAPEIMGIGPAHSIPKALGMAGLKQDEVDCFEINEAFAAQFLAVNRELGLDLEKVNPNGSGIALGHPLGCTGARLLVSLVHELRRRSGRYGVASQCAGGGPSMATVIELVS